jgi:hypothetical protein
MATTYPRAETKRRICEAVERGASLTELGRRPGFPCRSLVTRWAKQDEAFACALRNALNWGRGLRHERFCAPSFDFEVAQRMLADIRRGRNLRSLLDDPAFPNWKKLQRWRRERPDFAEDLARALDAKPRRKRGPRPYDEAVADRFICRLNAGEPLAEVFKDPAMPGRKVLDRWGAERPEFDYALGLAMRSGHRVRMRARQVVTAAVADEVVRRVQAGETLTSIARTPGVPTQPTLRMHMRRDICFAHRVEEAMRIRDDALADEALSIAEQATPETLAEAKLRVAAIKRHLGRIGPKRRRGSSNR